MPAREAEQGFSVVQYGGRQPAAATDGMLPDGGSASKGCKGRNRLDCDASR